MIKIIKQILFVCIAVATLTFLLLPWRVVVEHYVTLAMRGSGLQNPKFTLVEISVNHTTLKDLSFEKNGMAFTGAEIIFNKVPIADSDPSLRTLKWKWEGKNITMSGLPVAVPVTNASGTVTIGSDNILLDGKWSSPDRAFAADFAMNYSQLFPEKAEVKLASFAMPWGGGSIALKDAVIPLSGNTYTVAVIVKSVLIDAILKPLTGDRATATGSVSGTIPVVITPGGGLPMPQDGSLKASGPGTIVMQPDAIPGDNEQVSMLRDVLKDFHYNILSLTLNKDEAKKDLAATLTVEGNNPAMYNGRAVKLNVHLSGDVLDFVRQGMATSDPRTLLKQGEHAK